MQEQITAAIRKDIDAICCIYKTVGDAMFEEVRERLALRIVETFDREMIASYEKFAKEYRQPFGQSNKELAS